MAAPNRLTPSLRLLQQDILDRVRDAEPGIQNVDIARVAGVEPCEVSKWTTSGLDGRLMAYVAVRNLAAIYGWDAIIGPDARQDGERVEKIAPPSADMATAGSDLKQALLTLLLAYERATSPQSDGKADISEAEWAELGPLLDRVRPAVDALDAHRPGSPQAPIPFDAKRGGA